MLLVIPSDNAVGIGVNVDRKGLRYVANSSHTRTLKVSNVSVGLGYLTEPVRIGYSDLKVNLVPFELRLHVAGAREHGLGLAFIGMLDRDLDFGSGNSRIVHPHGSIRVLVLLCQRISLGTDGDGHRGS